MRTSCPHPPCLSHAAPAVRTATGVHAVRRAVPVRGGEHHARAPPDLQRAPAGAGARRPAAGAPPRWLGRGRASGRASRRPRLCCIARPYLTPGRPPAGPASSRQTHPGCHPARPSRACAACWSARCAACRCCWSATCCRWALLVPLAAAGAGSLWQAGCCWSGRRGGRRVPALLLVCSRLPASGSEERDAPARQPSTTPHPDRRTNPASRTDPTACSCRRWTRARWTPRRRPSWRCRTWRRSWSSARVLVSGLRVRLRAWVGKPAGKPAPRRRAGFSLLVCRPSPGLTFAVPSRRRHRRRRCAAGTASLRGARSATAPRCATAAWCSRPTPGGACSCLCACSSRRVAAVAPAVAWMRAALRRLHACSMPARGQHTCMRPWKLARPCRCTASDHQFIIVHSHPPCLPPSYLRRCTASATSSSSESCRPSAPAPPRRRSWPRCGAPAGAAAAALPPRGGGRLPPTGRLHALSFMHLTSAPLPAPHTPPPRAPRCVPRSRPLHERPTWVDDGILPTRLYCKNVEVERENAEELARLPGPAHESRAGAGGRGPPGCVPRRPALQSLPPLLPPPLPPLLLLVCCGATARFMRTGCLPAPPRSAPPGAQGPSRRGPALQGGPAARAEAAGADAQGAGRGPQGGRCAVGGCSSSSSSSSFCSKGGGQRVKGPGGGGCRPVAAGCPPLVRPSFQCHTHTTAALFWPRRSRSCWCSRRARRCAALLPRES